MLMYCILLFSNVLMFYFYKRKSDDHGKHITLVSSEDVTHTQCRFYGHGYFLRALY